MLMKTTDQENTATRYRLSAIGEASERDVVKWRERINTDGGREIGERVLAVVDRITSAYKATLIGKVFREYLDGRCDCSSFLRTVEMIDSALTEDLLFLANDLGRAGVGGQGRRRRCLSQVDRSRPHEGSRKPHGIGEFAATRTFCRGIPDPIGCTPCHMTAGCGSVGSLG